jgi:hypothetical protein
VEWTKCTDGRTFAADPADCEFYRQRAITMGLKMFSQIILSKIGAAKMSPFVYNQNLLLDDYF